MAVDRFQSLTLESAQFYVQHVLSAHGFYGAPMTTVRTMLDHMTGDMIVSMEREIWAEPTLTHTVRHPRDWWEHVKQRWFPQWALARWPVIETVHAFDLQRLYPEYIFKAQRPHFRVAVMVADSAPRVARDGDDGYDAAFYS